MIKGGLAWLLWQERGVVNSVVELVSSSVGLVVYRREEGGRNSKYIASKCITMHDMTSIDARCALTWYEVVPVKGETSGKISPVFRVFGQRSRRGKVASSIG